MVYVSAQFQSYLEISEYRVLYKRPAPIPDCICTDSPSYLSITQAINYIRYMHVSVCWSVVMLSSSLFIIYCVHYSSKQKPKRKFLDVYGNIDAISDLLRLGTCMVQCAASVG